jgi:hypothetical protein
MTTTCTTTVVDIGSSPQQAAVPVFFTSHDPIFTEEPHNVDSDGDDIHVDSHLNSGTSLAPHDSSAPTNNSNQQERIRKRKKPTLNCLACVDRKSKCDRARPSCLLW